MDYTKHFQTVDPRTPTNEAQPGREAEMVTNNAGGMVFAVTPMKQVERFLILGTEGGTYYQKEKAITRENAKNAFALIQSGSGREIVKMIVDISKAGRAPKNDPAIYLLAMVAGCGDADAKQYALALMPDVCRTGTHLFQFAEALQGFRGWGRGVRTAFADWYESKGLGGAVYQAIKYQNRNGWTHRDILRKCHASSLSLQPLFQAITQPEKYANETPIWEDNPMQQYDAAMRTLRVQEGDKAGIKRALNDIVDFGLPHECIPGHMKAMPETWRVLVDTDNLPYMACLRNLGAMTANGALSPLSDTAVKVNALILDFERMTKARIHPLHLLVAQKVYASGKGVRGKLAWKPLQGIIDNLNDAFYQSFQAVEPTGKRFFLGIDVSGSMTWTSNGVCDGVLTAAEGASVMALATANVEPNYFIMGFCDKPKELNISPRQRLADAMRTVYNNKMGRTDCSLPMVYAEQNKIPVDTFVIYTDNETWFDNKHGHPSEALRRYRQKMGIGAKLVVVGMESTGFTIADPMDAGMLDIVGFDTACPALIADFARN